TERALLPADRCVFPAYRLPGAGQHQLQRARRADCLHAAGCVSLFSGNAHGCPGAGKCYGYEEAVGEWPGGNRPPAGIRRLMRRKTDAVVRHSTESIDETAANVRSAACAIPDRATSLVCANAVGAADFVGPLRDRYLVRHRRRVLAADHAAPFRGLD